MNSKDLRRRARRAPDQNGRSFAENRRPYQVLLLLRPYRPGLSQGHRRCGGWPSVRSDPDGHPREPGPPGGYTEGFLRRHNHSEYQNYDYGYSVSDTQQFVGEITGRNGDMVEVEVKNKFLLATAWS